MNNEYYYCKECHGSLFLYEENNKPDITDGGCCTIDGEKYCKACKDDGVMSKLIPYKCHRCGAETGRMSPSSSSREDEDYIELICNRCYVKETIRDTLHEMTQPMFDELVDYRDMGYSDALYLIMQEMELSVREKKIELRNYITKKG